MIDYDNLNYGKEPEVIGHTNFEYDQFCYVLYLPISENPLDSLIYIPENIYTKQLRHFIDKCLLYEMGLNLRLGQRNKKYIYLTLKNFFVTKDSPGNRPGWHMDGFGSKGDVNYIWANINPTEFAVQKFTNISKDDRQSMVDITNQVDPNRIVTYPNKTLLRLDEEVVHRVGPVEEEGIRTFVKITFSNHKFTNKGNAYNPKLPFDLEYTERTLDRNLDSK